MPELFESARGAVGNADGAALKKAGEIPAPVDSLEHEKIASAPGDLPFAELVARQIARRSQFRHDNTIEPLAPAPGRGVVVWATSGEDLPLERASVFYTTDGSCPDLSSSALEMKRAGQQWDMHAGFLTRWQAKIPAQPAGTIVRYRIAGWHSRFDRDQFSAQEQMIWAQDGSGFAFHFSGARAFTTFSYTIEAPDTPRVPAWIENAVIYQIFLDRFRADTPDGNFPRDLPPQALHGGTLNGVRAALPYLEELGVNCLWLSPLHRAETYHRYDALDYFTVDPRLGSNADLKALTDEAHARGMRVLLDFVPSHISLRHPAFLSAQADRRAPSYDWFFWKEWPHDYANFLDAVPGLPSFRSESEGARQHIIASAVQWLRDYGVDGFRIDHSIGLGMDFWTMFRQATRAVRSDVFSVAEATDTPEVLLRYRGRLDSILDFPLAAALRSTFGARSWSLSRFDHFLSAYEQYMASGPGQVSFLDNHDMNRFLFVARDRVEQLKLAALCQFTLAPIPVIYYGTEVGMSQRADLSSADFGGDAEARRDMSWRQEDWNLDLLTFYRSLVHLRTSLPILARGQRHTVSLSAGQQTYAYIRTHHSGRHLNAGDALVLVNLDEREQTFSLPPSLLPAGASLALSTGVEPLVKRRRHQVELTLAPSSGAVFSLK